MIRKSPMREEKIISLPFLSRSGSPAEVSTVALPAKTERKAIPPEMPKTIDRIERTKGAADGSVERQPITV